MSAGVWELLLLITWSVELYVWCEGVRVCGWEGGGGSLKKGLYVVWLSMGLSYGPMTIDL